MLILSAVLFLSVAADTQLYGVNVLTGTDEAWGCETLPENVRALDSQFKLVEEEGHSYLKSTRSETGYTSNDTLYFKAPLPAGTYRITFKAAKVSSTPNTSIGWYPLYLLHDSNRIADPVYIAGFNSTTEVVWRTFSGVITSEAEMESIGLQWRKDEPEEYALFDELSICAAIPAAGINVLTGKEAPLTFDEGLPTYIAGSQCRLSVQSDPLDASHKVLALESTTGKYPKATFSFAETPLAGKYLVSFKEYKVSAEVESGNRWILYRYAGESGEKNSGDGMFLPSQTWVKREFILDFSKPITEISLQWETDPSNTNMETAYFDEICVTPLYEIVYRDAEGILRTEYKRLTGTSFVPAVTAADKERFICGWSLENDETVDESIPLSNRPLTLYAVHEKQPRITFALSENLLSGAGVGTYITPKVSSYYPTDGLTYRYELVFGAETVSLSTQADGAFVQSKAEGLAAVRCTASCGTEATVYILSDYQNACAVRIVDMPTDLHSSSAYAKAVCFGKGVADSEFIWSVSDPGALQLLGGSDGTVELVPLKNATVTVSVSLKGFPALTDSAHVVLSDQDERVPVYDFEILFLGASTVLHSPSTSLGWTGSWGMAASSRDKDYVHRYMSYLEDEFSPCSIHETILPIAAQGLDGYIATDTRNTFDYTKTVQYASLKSTLETQKPHLIVFTIASNAKDDSSPDTALRAYKTYFDLIYELCPQAVVLMASCPINHSSLRHTLATGLMECYADKGMLWYDCDIPGHSEYFASEWLALGQPGVAAHPNDAGMEQIATGLFATSLQSIRTHIFPSDYTLLPTALQIVGANGLTADEPCASFTVTPVPSNASADVLWTVDNEDLASVSSDGVMTAKNNGTVTLTAVCKYNEAVSASKQITLSGFPPAYTVTYAPGCTDTVSGLPEKKSYVRGEFTLSDSIPCRDAYFFVGWGLTENASSCVNTVQVDSDRTVYALWKKIDGFDFETDYDESKNYTYGFRIVGGFHAHTSGGALSVICTQGERVRFVSPVLDIENRGYVTFALTSAHVEAGDTVELTVHTTAESAVYSFALHTTEACVYAADVSALTGKITGIEIYVNAALEASMFEVMLDYVHFLQEPQLGADTKFVRLKLPSDVDLCLSYEKNTEELVIGAAYDENGRLCSVSFLSDGKLSLGAKKGKTARVFAFDKALKPLREPTRIYIE